jgi:hypothetical protein
MMLFRFWTGSRRATNSKSRRRSAAQVVEQLEARLLLTSWTGDIPDGTVWAAGQVQRITGDVHVPAGSTLTIQPGAVIKFDLNHNFTVDGTLSANGTAVSPIVFTDIRDDTGGDTNGDGANTGPLNGDWGNLNFQSDSTSSVLDHVEIRYGGHGGAAELIVNGGQLTFSNGVVRNSISSGVRIQNSNPTFTNDVYQNNNSAAISTDLVSNPAIHGVTTANNGLNALVLDAGTLPGNTIWNNPDIVYSFSNNINVPQGNTLTIGAGQIIKRNGSQALIVNGSLSAIGTQAAPIVFADLDDDTIGGDTNNNGTNSSAGNGGTGDIEFSNTSTANVLDHVEVRNARTISSAAVVVDSAPLTFTNSVIRNSSQAGLRILSSNPILTNLTFQSNNGAAISMDLASNPAIHGVTTVNNGLNDLRLDGGTLVTNGIWDDPDIVYQFASDITVPEGKTLTIAAGQIIKRTGSQNLKVDGSLIANGSQIDPIIFADGDDDTAGGDTNNNGTNSSAPNGNSGAIRFSSTSTANLLDHVQIRNGGAGNAGSIVVDAAPLTMTNSLIQNSDQAGLRILSSNPTLTNVTFQNNINSAAISMDLASSPVITGVTLLNNRINGVAVDGGTLPALATWNNPGIVYVLAGNGGVVTIPEGRTLDVAAGQVIKLLNHTDAFHVNGTLKVEGTAAAPVVITSYSDDTAGGDTNDDGHNSGPSVANWGGISFTATSVGSQLDHLQLRYGSDTTDGKFGTINVTGSSVTVTNSLITDSGHVGADVFAGGTLTLTNSLVVHCSGVGIQAEAGSTLIATNDTIDGNLQGVLLNSATATLKNDLFTNNAQAGILQNGPANLTLSFSDVFGNGNNYSGLAPQTNLNGNLSVDPKYFNRQGSQYQLHAGSPVEDAGTGAGAKATDFFGNPRFKDPNLAGRGDGSGVDMGAIEVQQTATSDVDLTVNGITGPATGTQNQTVTVNWIVLSAGTATATGSWHDSVYLSPSPIFTADAILLGTVQHTGNLAPGQSYTASGTFALPGVAPGDYYYLVRTNSQNEVFEGSQFANNVAASSQTVATSLPSLSLATPVTGTLAGTGAGMLYQITAAAGTDLSIALAGVSGDINELYISYGFAPTRQSYDARGVVAGSANQTASIANTQAGTYYVLVYGAKVPTSEPFTLTASTPVFSISSIGPTQGSNTGKVTLTVNGADFDNTSHPQIVNSAGVTIQPVQLYYIDSRTISATFDLTGLPTGASDIQVVHPGRATQTLAHGFNIIAGQAGALTASISTTRDTRVGQVYPIVITYANTGDTDTLTLTLGGYPETAIDWNAVTPLIHPVQPEAIPDDQWQNFVNHLSANIGPTWADLQRAISTDATLLPPLLGRNHSLSDVFQLEIAKVKGQLQPALTGTVYLGDTSQPLGNVQISIGDPATGTTYQTVSLMDGSFLIPFISAEKYELQFSGYTSLNKTLEVGDSGLSGVQLIVNPAGVISGRIVNAQGAPLPGLNVVAFADDGTPYLTTTRADGTYQIDSLPAGNYHVETGGGTLTQSVISDISVTDGGRHGNVNLILQTAATISGIITGPNGPVAGAIVSASNEDGNGSSAETDATGHYTITGLSGAVYSLSVNAAGLASHVSDDVNLALGAALTGQNFSLTTGGGVAGQITLAGSGAPVADAFLSLEGPAGMFSAVADDSGQFSFADLPAGSYTLTASVSGSMTASANVTITAGNTATANLTTALLGTVNGQVTNSVTHAPLPKVIVQVIGPTGLVANTLADAQGNYEFDGLDAGTYQIVLGDFGSPGVVRTIITLSAGQNSATDNLSTALAGVMSGTVFADDGVTPVADVPVILLSNGTQVVSTTTDDAGQYVFDLLVSGTYELRAITTGMSFPVIQGVAVSGGAHLTDLNFRAGSRTIRGTVHNQATNQPVAGARVVITLNDPVAGPIAVDSDVTATDGSFSVTDVPAGIYSVRVITDTSISLTQSVTIATTDPVPLVFNLVAGSALQGTVRDSATGLPLGTASLHMFRNTDPQGGGTTVTDADGQYQLTGLAAGSYRLLVQAPGSASVLLTNVLVGPTTTLLNVSLIAATTSLNGTATGVAGPLSDATVVVRDAQGVVWGTTPTASDGTFMVSGLPAGSYELSVGALGYLPVAPMPVQILTGQTLNGITLNATATAITDALASNSTTIAGLPDAVSKIYVLPDRDNRLMTPGALEAIECADPNATADLRQEAIRLSQVASYGYSDLQRAYYHVGKAVDDLKSKLANLSAIIQSLSSKIEAIQVLTQYRIADINFRDLLGTLSSDLAIAKQRYSALNTGIVTDDSPFDDHLRVDLERAEVFLFNVPSSYLILHPELYYNANTYAFEMASLVADFKFFDEQAHVAIRDDEREFNYYQQMTMDYVQADAAAIRAYDDFVRACNCSAGAQVGLPYAPLFPTTEQPHTLQANAVVATSDDFVKPGVCIMVPVKPIGTPKPPPGSGSTGSGADPAPIHTTTSTVVGTVVKVKKTSIDPNDFVGPAGFGTQSFIQPQTMPYRVDFENDPAHATAAAQVVSTTFTIDSDLDPSTLQFTGFGFGQQNIALPPGLYHYQTTLDLRPQGINLLVPVTLDENPVTGVVTVKFQSLDPITNLPPEGVNDGFLPVDNAAGDGQGYFTFTVQPKAGLPTGTQITEQTSIVFDTNAGVQTPTALNTIDAGTPTSSVTALPAQSPANFTVGWSGRDDAGGSGIAAYDIYVSDNGSDFSLWQSATIATSASYAGQGGHTYRFYSVARDNVGHVELAPLAADATTTTEMINIPPVIANQSFSVAENSAANTTVGTVVASSSSNLTYSITAGNAGINFSIDPTSGVIKVAAGAALNFETTATYTFTVQVADNATPSLSSSAQMTIHVTDVNEAPSIPAGQTFTIAATANSGASVGMVSATDPDTTVPNSSRHFSILNGTGAFTIDALTGQISVGNTSALMALAGQVVTLQVTDTDGVTPPLSATQSVSITVGSLSTAPLLATPGPVSTFIGNVKTPVKITPTLSVTDPDSPTSLASIIITLPLGAAKKNPDIVSFPGLSAIGTRTDAIVSGRLQITITLKPGATNAAVQSMLDGMTFQTTGKGLKLLSRNFQIQVIDQTGLHSNTVTQNVVVQKKLPK